MPIEKSGNYVEDMKSRKLFGRMHTEIVALSAQIDNVLTAANGMRLALGAATLTLAEVEALHVQQSHEKRSNDALLFEAQARLGDMLDAAKLNLASVGTVISNQAPKVEGLFNQAKRIATRDIVDNEPTAPLPGLEYVEATYFRDLLSCSMSHVRNLIERGALPSHDAVSSEDSGRPKFLWLKHKAAVAIVQNMQTKPLKKGVAALI
jgi:hypothetical protein